jgi:hypothetical protein
MTENEFYLDDEVPEVEFHDLVANVHAVALYFVADMT